MSLRKRIALILGVALIGISIGANAFAETGTSSGSGLSISPTRFDLQVDQGKSAEIKVNLKNISGVDIVAKVAINDFEADGHSGEPHILTNSNQSNPQSIRNLLTDVTDIPLQKDSSKTISINLHVPQDAAPGAYYGIIRYAAVSQTQASDTNNSVSLTASVGAVVLLTVPGNIKEQVQVNRVAVYQRNDTTNSSSFFISRPQVVGVDVKNLGNGFAQPFGNVNVTNMFNKQVYTYQINATTPRGVVLPNSNRTFKDEIKNIKLPGRYTVTANVSYGTGGQVLIVTNNFWYVPIWLIVILVVLFGILIVVGYVLYRRMSRRPSKLRRK